MSNNQHTLDQNILRQVFFIRYYPGAWAPAFL